ncbi:MAG: ABC transporter permease subunit [Bdellovibrionales bacterium]|nr:ABC transporter permease subunit [Bdellovibrionales bacterium]
MRAVLVLAGKEVRSAFVTPLAYIVCAGFLLLSGFFFFTLLQGFNSHLSQAALLRDDCPNLNQWVVLPFLHALELTLLFLVPILTMRSVAEEKQQGTFELLVTSPITPLQIVLGKFLGVVSVAAVMLLFAFVFPLVLIVFSDPEIWPIFSGFLALALYTSAFLALGLAVSACTRSQTIAGVVTLVLLLVFYIIHAPAPKLGGRLAEVLNYLSPSNHVDLLFRGVITGVDIVYFLSVMLFGLFLAVRALEAQDWR